MKNRFAAILTAVALAVPLGIGGLTLAASSAGAVSPGYHFSTCSRHVIWKCHTDIQEKILFYQGYARLFDSAAVLPRGSNGRDQAAYGALDWRVRTRFEDWREAQRFLREFFSDLDVRQFNRNAAYEDRFEYNQGSTSSAGSYISPDDRARFEAHLAELEERRAREKNPAEPETAFQITPIEPFDSLAEIDEIENHRQATLDNRGRIVELQEEVTGHEDRLQELEPVVERNVQVIEALGDSVGVLSEAVTGLVENTAKNTAGIALAYALDAPGLSYGKRFAITGALGQFRGESAVGFSGTFKAGEFVLISVGGGFAG